MESIFRVGGALLIGAALIGGAFYIEHRGIADSQAASSPALVVANDTVRSVQTNEDTDGDGIADWEEELQGTDPLIHTTFESSTSTPDSDGEYSPNTVTDRFAQTFLEDLIRTGAGKEELTEEEKISVAKRSAEALTKELEEQLYTRAHLRIISDDSMAAIRKYGNDISTVIEKYPAPEEHEMLVLQRALQTSDQALLERLTPLREAYASMVQDMLATDVPPSMAQVHVVLVNSLSLIHSDILSMQNVFTDPVPALMRVQRYESDATALLYALNDIRKILDSHKIVYTNTEPGMFLFRINP